MGEVRRDRASVLIVEDGRVLLMRRIRKGREYYILPGGGIEQGETPEQAAVREAKEETGLSITLARKLCTRDNEGRTGHYFLAADHRGKLEIGWPERGRQTPENRYSLEWVGPDRLGNITLQPPEALRICHSILQAPPA